MQRSTVSISQSLCMRLCGLCFWSHFLLFYANPIWYQTTRDKSLPKLSSGPIWFSPRRALISMFRLSSASNALSSCLFPQFLGIASARLQLFIAISLWTQLPVRPLFLQSHRGQVSMASPLLTSNFAHSFRRSCLGSTWTLPFFPLIVFDGVGQRLHLTVISLPKSSSCREIGKATLISFIWNYLSTRSSRLVALWQTSYILCFRRNYDQIYRYVLAYFFNHPFKFSLFNPLSFPPLQFGRFGVSVYCSVIGPAVFALSNKLIFLQTVASSWWRGLIEKSFINDG